MVIVPVNADEDKAQHVAQEGGSQRTESRPVIAFRRMQFEHHDRNDDGDHAIAERFQSSFCHTCKDNRKQVKDASLAPPVPQGETPCPNTTFDLLQKAQAPDHGDTEKNKEDSVTLLSPLEDSVSVVQVELNKHFRLLIQEVY